MEHRVPKDCIFVRGLWSVVLTDIEGRSPKRVHTPPRARDIVQVAQSFERGLAVRVIEVSRIRGKFETFALDVFKFAIRLLRERYVSRFRAREREVVVHEPRPGATPSSTFKGFLPRTTKEFEIQYAAPYEREGRVLGMHGHPTIAYIRGFVVVLDAAKSIRVGRGFRWVSAELLKLEKHISYYTWNERTKVPAIATSVAATVIATRGLSCKVVTGSSPLGHIRSEQSPPV